MSSGQPPPTKRLKQVQLTQLRFMTASSRGISISRTVTMPVSQYHTASQSASEMSYIVSGGALNSTHSLTHCFTRQGKHLQIGIWIQQIA